MLISIRLNAFHAQLSGWTPQHEREVGQTAHYWDGSQHDTLATLQVLKGIVLIAHLPTIQIYNTRADITGTLHGHFQYANLAIELFWVWCTALFFLYWLRYHTHMLFFSLPFPPLYTVLLLASYTIISFCVSDEYNVWSFLLLMQT